MVVASALFLSYAYFYQAGGWNQNSRFALVRAVLERHTLQIDAYQLHTGDRALWNGHYYSDKAPGASFVAIAPVQAARVVSRAAGVDPEGFPGIAWTSYVAGVATSSLFTAIAAWCVFWLSVRWGASRGAAIFAATAYGLASPAWAYATLFMGHGQTAGCLMIAFAAAERLGSDRHGAKLKPRDATMAWVVGLSGGWAVVTEYPAAIPAVFIGLLALERTWHARVRLKPDATDSRVRPKPDATDSRRDAREIVAVVVRIAAGVALAAAPLFAHNALAFDSPLRLGYSNEEGFKEMRTGLFGITYPKMSTLVELLVGRYRGLLPLSPLMAAAPLGVWLLARKRRGPALVAAGIGVYYLLLNSSYFFWEGGWAFGPRQLTPGLPFLALGLAPLWDRAPRAGRLVLAAAWLWGVSITLVAVSTTPQPPSSFKAPVQELLWPAFKDGDLSLNPQTFVHNSVDVGLLRGGAVPHAAWNLGEIAGLRGLASLLPLIGMWVFAAAILLRGAAQDLSSAQREAGPESGPQQFGNAEANLRFLEATGALTPAAEVLEIGTGAGGMLHTLLERGHRVRGVEVNPQLIAESRRWFGDLPVQAVANVNLPFADASFDVVLSFDVFEHIRDSDAHLREVHRVLRPGGLYLIQTPNKWSNVVFETIRWRSFTRWREDHCSLHTPGQLRRRLEAHGFRVQFFDVPVVNQFFREKVRRHLGRPGVAAIALINPDRLPLQWRTNLYVKASRRSG